MYYIIMNYDRIGIMSYLPCELFCCKRENETVQNVVDYAEKDHLAVIAVIDEDVSDGAVPVINAGCAKLAEIGVTALGGTYRPDESKDADENISKIKSFGGVAGVALSDSSSEKGLRNWRNVDFMEVWHGAFSPDNAYNGKAVELWTALLDKGYHISCTYARDTEDCFDNNAHYGCTYVDIDGEINASNAIRGIRMGKTVASGGAKFFFRVHQKGKTYSIGETLKKGNAVFSFFTDRHSREKNAGNDEVEYNIIKLITNSGECIMQSSASERHISVRLKSNHWYRAELWGKVNSQPRLLAVTSPIYTA